MKYHVQGEMLDTKGAVRGGDGAWYDADNLDDAGAQFLAAHKRSVAGVWDWRVTVAGRSDA